MRTFDSVTTSVYPWDVIGDPHGAATIAQTGVDHVTLPALYHSVRAATMRHPSHRIIETHATGLYTEFHQAFWGSRPIAPNAGSAWIGEIDAFELARDALKAEGLAVDAWVVLMHADELGGPGFAGAHLRNAIGDAYPWTLCPRAAGSLDYALDIVRAAAAEGADGIMLEACGVYGFDHLSSHDKTESAAITETDKVLLSFCFCDACRADLRDAGIDAADAAAAVLGALGGTPRDAAPADGVQEALGALADQLAAVRERTNTDFQNRVLAEARSLGFQRISFQSSADVWSAGFSASVRNPQIDIDVAIVNTNGPETEVSARLTDLAAVLGGGAAVLGAFSAIPAFAARDDLVGRWQFLSTSGARELHLYHAGLASNPTLAETTAALAALD